MEFIALKVKHTRKRVKKNFRFNIEQILCSLSIILFTIMIIMQGILTIPAARTSLVTNRELEGKPLGTEEYLYAQGEIVLGLKGKKTDENLKILINGKEIASFQTSNVILTVKDGDVLEVDGSDVPNSVEIEVANTSGNIIPGIIGKRVIVNSEVKKLTRVRMK